MKLSHQPLALRLVLATLAGASTTLAFAPYSIWPMAIISLILLLFTLLNATPKQALYLGLFWGIGQFSTGISWVHISIDNFGGMPPAVNWLLMALLILYLSLYPAIFAFAFKKFFSRSTKKAQYLFAAPALWLLSEWLRGWVMTGFPWLWLGYSQIESPLAAFAPVAGVDAITLLVALCAGAFVYSLIEKSFLGVFIIGGVFTASYVLQGIQWTTPNIDAPTKIALIQGNIAQETKWVPSYRWPTINQYTEDTNQHWDADIIIWPEAAIPAFETTVSSFLTSLDKTAKENETALITGVVNVHRKLTPESQGEIESRYYNSVLTIGDSIYGDYKFDITQRYNKHHLLPFGEFVPFEDYLRKLGPIFNLPMSSFTAGSYIQPNIVAKNNQLVAALCFEILFNEQIRQNITQSTDYILTLSNDAWFGDSIGPLQHMEIAQMRSLEFGKPVIRSTNNGVTAITDHKGNIAHQIPQFERATLKATIYPSIGETPYLKWGSWPLYFIVSLMFVAAASLRRKRVL
ncbi:apolipoprotein N-acyltransferase [Vibrio sp.]|nr:apolipoprotein N-acyltransferase [Vibrio sp.]